MQTLTDIFILNLLLFITIGLIRKVYYSKHHLNRDRHSIMTLWTAVTFVYSVFYLGYFIADCIRGLS